MQRVPLVPQGQVVHRVLLAPALPELLGRLDHQVLQVRVGLQVLESLVQRDLPVRRGPQDLQVRQAQGQQVRLAQVVPVDLVDHQDQLEPE